MAGRRPKRGIEFSGWDVGIFDNDTKIDALLEAQGWFGFSIYFYLCQKAYASDGYFYRWSYANAATTARRMGGGIGSETVTQTVDTCFRIGLFDKRLFEWGSVLTSKGIQRGYAMAIQNRRIKTVEKQLWLLDPEETKGFGITVEDVDLLGANSHLQEANTNLREANSHLQGANAHLQDHASIRVEESIGEKSKVEQSRGEKRRAKEHGGSPHTPLLTADAARQLIEGRFFPADLEETVINWTQYKLEKRQGYKETGFKSLLTQIEKNAELYGKDAVIDIIVKSMSNNWQGIIWDKLRNQRDIRSRISEVDSW